MKDLNATQAAIRAGYSERSAEIIGFENLRKPRIAEQLKKEIDKRSERVKMTADDVLREIIELMERNKKTDDKLSLDALKLLGKHHKLFTDVVETKLNIESATGVKIELIDDDS
jgi:phage terminase small subunit